MPNIGPVELIVILVIALIVIGPGRLPDVGAALGKSIKEFRKASSDIADSTRVDTQPPAAAAPATPPAPAAPNTLGSESAPNTLSQAPAPAPSAEPAPTPELVQPAPATPTSPSPVAVPHVDDDAGRPA